MGREPTRKGKYVLLYPACCIVLLFGIWGCTHFAEKWKGEGRLARADTLLAKGEYGASLRETKEVLRLYPRALGDEALFQMGLIYACPKNPDQDYQRSLKRFGRVIKEFPKSKMRNQAEAWVLFIQEIMDREREIGDLKQRNSHLESQVEKLKDQLLRLKEIDLGIEKKKSQAK
jgi:outer membrane protein assembly factor BamD (BamD/ComL family)